MSKKRKIVKYKRPRNFNIGVVIFFIIIIYVLFNIYSYFTKTHISEFQVQQGTIASNHIYQGIIVRDETVEYAGYDGYINYYVKSASKVSVNDVIYSIDTTGTIYHEMLESIATSDILSNETLLSVSGKLDAFIQDYNANRFFTSYAFYNNLSSELIQNLNTNALADVSSKVSAAEGNSTFYKITSDRAGVIAYEIDGLEEYTVEEMLKKDLNYNEYKETHLLYNTKVTESTPVYKRVNSEDWNILVPISETLAKELNEKSSISIRFCKDDFKTTASCSTIKEGEQYYLNLFLKKAMVRYINDRFIDVELVMGEKTGLKIPQSAITSKEFFTIPKEYFILDEDSNQLGFYVRREEGKEEWITPTLYYENEDYYYVDSEEVSDGEWIVFNDFEVSYQIGTEKDALLGVYNVNKGYAVFKQIHIIYENAEYAIVETKTSYGISLYDHIALNAEAIEEHQLTAK